MKRSSNCRSNAAGQQGAAILVVTILLLLVATIGTLMVGRVGLVEQKAVGTDVRSKEVYSAAIGGLEYGVSWFRENFTELDFQGGEANGVGGSDTAPTYQTVLNADTYNHEITYRLKTAANPDDAGMPVIVEVISTAVAQNDSHVEKRVSVEVMMGRVTSPFANATPGGDPIFSGPPIMVERCVDPGGITGNPAVYTDGGLVIGTTSGLSSNPDIQGCLDTGALRQCPPGHHPQATCPTVSPSSRVALDPQTNSMWDAVFAITPAQLKAMSMDEATAATVLYVDNDYRHVPSLQPSLNLNGGNNGTIGSASEPVILFFADEVGCPKLNGTTTVYGLVYYENSDCGNQGWGAGTVHGTVAVSGNLSQFNANPQVHNLTLDFSSIGGTATGTTIHPGISETLAKFAEIPGSWRDF